MDGGVASLHGLLGAVERAMPRAYHIDSLLYAEMLELRTKLEHEASRADADVDLSRPRVVAISYGLDWLSMSLTRFALPTGFSQITPSWFRSTLAATAAVCVV